MKAALKIGAAILFFYGLESPQTAGYSRRRSVLYVCSLKGGSIIRLATGIQQRGLHVTYLLTPEYSGCAYVLQLVHSFRHNQYKVYLSMMNTLGIEDESPVRALL